ncbi:dihydroorotase [Facklamia miroungae]|uniref:Dihydroorotase n=1 Tax=Facklamia miroungae TaxID=120956 RepID=A0A1G7U233_9LACT|nr:dihydroorotase [Facklamia miroungae]NKZ29870.1 dihydroorotase [Facklamia miroungae]SDG41434.1 dihydroorotase [Facklamia miroungae]
MLLIKNVRMLNHQGGFQPVEILIKEQRICAIGIDLLNELSHEELKIFDGQGGLITPGLVDLHVHFRQPGFEGKETIQTGTQAAARGGFTQVCAMPNLNPVPDNLEDFTDLIKLNQQEACIKVHQYAPISLGITSEEELVNFSALTKAGAVAFTNDGKGVQTAGLMLQAMQIAQQLDRPIVAHTEDNSLLFGGVMHKGKASERLGLPGIFSATESSQIARDCILAKEADCHYHVCHVSTKESVAVIRAAKAEGVRVTCEVCPHHLLLCDEDIPQDEGNWKMNPPLRSRFDQAALIQGLLDGTIDCIATDHAPHMAEEKNQSMLKAPFGIVGSETAFALLYTYLVERGICSLQQLIHWMSWAPAKLFNLQSSALEVGSVADLAIFDINQDFPIDPSEFASKASNTPFVGWQVKGRTLATIYQGHLVYQD